MGYKGGDANVKCDPVMIDMLDTRVHHRTRRVRVAGRLLVGFGERTCAAEGATFLEAARVLRAAGTGAGTPGLVVALTRFFGTLSSSFSLSPSSDGRVLPRVTAFGAVFGAAFGGTALAFRAAGCVARAAFGAASLFVGEDFATFVGAWADGSSSSERLMVRLLLGMRLTRRSKRDRRLATWASHMATSFSPRAFTIVNVSGRKNIERRYLHSSSRLALTAAFASVVRCDMFVDVCLFIAGLAIEAPTPIVA
jgi:hypothetical protein